MTPPDSFVAQTVYGKSRKDLEAILEKYDVAPTMFKAQDDLVLIAKVALKIWDEWDRTAEIAVRQNQTVQKIQTRFLALELIWKAVQAFQERGYESGFKEMNDAIIRMIRSQAKSD